VNDSQYFLLEHFDTIHNFPSQVYHSALPLSPSSSWLHKYFAVELSQEVRVVKGLPVEWKLSSHNVRLNNLPQALACQKNIIAVGLFHGDITILNAITGSKVALLSGHSKRVTSLTFSLDGTSIVSGSWDKTLKLWDVQTGGIIKTFCGHTDWVLSVSISANYTTISSGSRDKTIRLWDIWTEECHCVIEQQGKVDYVAFSPTNPQYLISASGDVVQGWDIDGHQVGVTHIGSHPAFSLDGTHFILCHGNVATVQNSDSGVVVAKCLVPNNSSGTNPKLICPCFSPDGRLVAAAAKTSAYIWDITGSEPLLIKTITGPFMSAIAFSSSSILISASHDKSVTFWQIGGPPGNLKSTPQTSVPISYISLQAESGIAISHANDGEGMIWDIQTGLCKASFQHQTRGVAWVDAQMIDGRLILAELGAHNIYISDVGKAKIILTPDVHWDSCHGLRISGDGSKIFCLIDGFIKAWSMSTGDAVGEVEVGTGNDSYLDPLYVGGSRIWAQSVDGLVQGWDFGISGSPPVPLSNTPPERPHLHMVCGFDVWGSRPCWIEDTVTGKTVFRLSGRYARPTYPRWDGRYLVAGFNSGEVLILDFNHLCLK
jgi:WD40 repeat protein